MKAYVFPGQGSQYPGMGKDLYSSSKLAKELFLTADEILGFNISEIIFNGSMEDLKEELTRLGLKVSHGALAATVFV